MCACMRVPRLEDVGKPERRQGADRNESSDRWEQVKRCAFFRLCWWFGCPDEVQGLAVRGKRRESCEYSVFSFLFLLGLVPSRVSAFKCCVRACLSLYEYHSSLLFVGFDVRCCLRTHAPRQSSEERQFGRIFCYPVLDTANW